MIGAVSGNKCSGNLELSDATAALPIIVCIPHCKETGDEVSSKTRHWLMDLRDGSTVVLGLFTVIVERTEESEGCRNNNRISIYIHSEDIKILQKKLPKRQEGAPSNMFKIPPSCLYILVKSKNVLRTQGPPNTNCGFDTQSLTDSSLENVQGIPQPFSVGACNNSPLPVAVVFKTARWYSYLHNGCIYHLSSNKDSKETLPSQETLMKDPCVTVGDEVQVELIGLPSMEQYVHHCGRILEIGELVSKLYLPKLQTSFTAPNDHQHSRFS